MGKDYTYKDRKIGVINESGTRFTAFKKTNTKDPEHDCVFRKYNSLGFEEAIIDELIALGIKEIIIILKNEQDMTEELFITLPYDWKIGAKVYKDVVFGVQKHIPIEDLRDMTVKRKMLK
jgi:hypothetical protein